MNLTIICAETTTNKTIIKLSISKSKIDAKKLKITRIKFAFLNLFRLKVSIIFLSFIIEIDLIALKIIKSETNKLYEKFKFINLKREDI